MKFRDLTELASSNLRNSLLRNSLTAAGIGVGIASLVAMLSLGVGLQELAGNRLSRSGLFNTVVVSPWRDSRDMARGGRGGSDAGPAQQPEETSGNDGGLPRPLDEDARKAIEQLPNVLDAQPEIRFVGEARLEKRAEIVPVGALAPSASDDEAFDTLQGKYFSSPDAPEAIVKLELAREWFPKDPASLVNQQIVLRYAERQPLASDSDTSSSATDSSDRSTRLSSGNAENNEQDYGFSVVRREQPLKVVGIIDEEPFGGMRATSRSRVFLPLAFVEKLNIMQGAESQGRFSGKKTYATLMARIANPSKVTEVQDAIRKMGFRTFSILDAARSLQRFFVILDLFLGIFGSMALAVASLGIVNTLVMSVLERRREIGIMKALGASDGDVKKLFFVEAGIMGLFGGMAGVAAGWAMGFAINFGTAYYLRQRDLPPETVSSVPVWLIAAAIGFAIVVSFVAGLYPASRAARLDPVQAIRYE